MKAFVVVLLYFLICPAVVLAQNFTENFELWPTDLKINGTVIASSGPKVDKKAVDVFVRSSGKDKAKVVALWIDAEYEAVPFEEILGRDSTRHFVNVSNPDFPNEKLGKALDEASGALIFSTQPAKGNAAKVLDSVREELSELLRRKGVVCVVGPVVSSFGAFRHDAIDSMSMITEDLGLFPDSIIYSSYADNSNRKRMYAALASKPKLVGVGIPDDTTVVLRGRKCFTLGEGKVTFAISANERQPYRIQHLGNVSGRRASPYDSVVDLTAWRRDAIERQMPSFPKANPSNPVVEKGTLFIVGGGGLPKGMMKEMVELAGGENAHMVYVPCSERDSVPENHWILNEWNKMGVASANVFHTKDRNKANTDEAFLETMKNATGVWFGGGRQWNFADSYYGTEAHRLMKQVLANGGVIGGSSAGASIQGGYLARANPVANFDIMAPGYERGLGFLPGVAIDQHFSQRRRQKDMTQLANRYPQLLGIGIDETTAIRVQGSTADVIGKGKVFFYDRRIPVIPGKPDYTSLTAGQSFDLVNRKVIENLGDE